MEKIRMFLALSLLSFLLVGCASKGNNATNVHENAPVSESGANTPTESNQSTDNNYSSVKDKNQAIPFSFSEFDMDVDYGANQAYKVKYENDKNGANASVENERKNEKVEGNKAYAQLEPLFKKLTFTAQSTDEEVKKEILSVFNISNNYQKIDLDVKFVDGVEKKYTFKP